MDINAAKQAGELSGRIDALKERVDSLTALSAAGGKILVFRVLLPDNKDVTIAMDGLADDKLVTASADAIRLAVSLYQAELDALQSQLAAL